MFNIFSKFAGNDEVDAEPTEAELKKQRIEFHRAKVRNGPVKFSEPTNGQIRRESQRRLKRSEKKAYRTEVRNYHEKQRLAMVLRGQLQLAGALPCVEPREIPLATQITATAWIVQRYGVEVTTDGVGTGHVSFRRADIVDAMQAALKFYTNATGHIVHLSSDFEPAISLAEEAVA